MNLHCALQIGWYLSQLKEDLHGTIFIASADSTGEATNIIMHVHMTDWGMDGKVSKMDTYLRQQAARLALLHPA